MKAATPNANSPKSIEIPTRDGSEVVEVFLDELPEEAVDLCEILVAEEAPIELFKQFAVHSIGSYVSHNYPIYCSWSIIREARSTPLQCSLSAGSTSQNCVNHPLPLPQS